MEKISLKAARVNSGLTQENIAEKMGVHRNTIIIWEKDPKKMTIKNAESLCKILNISLDNIFLS